MSTPNLTAVAAFVKYPERGRVKTRLAASVGETDALTIYKSLLAYTLKLLKSAATKNFASYVLADPYKSPAEYHNFLRPHGLEILMQQGRDLGDRLAQASSFLLSRHPSVLIIGSDCLELEVSHLIEAQEALKQTDVVLGPSEDGGYYLVGMKRFHRELFDGIAWSTSEVYSQTMERANRLNLSVASLPTLRDIDTREDWERSQDKLHEI